MQNLKITDEAHYKLKKYCDIKNLKMGEWVSEKLIELIKNNVYVEISPRASGKTTRLLSAVKKHIESGNELKPVIVTRNKEQGKWLKEILVIMGVNTDNIIFSQTMYIPQETVPTPSHRYFVDEFDFIDRDRLFISENGYYCSTLNNPEGDKFTQELYQTYLNSRLWK